MWEFSLLLHAVGVKIIQHLQKFKNGGLARELRRSNLHGDLVKPKKTLSLSWDDIWAALCSDCITTCFRFRSKFFNLEKS